MSEQHAAGKQDKRPARAKKPDKEAKHPARRHAKTLNNAPATISYPEELPVSARRQEIAEAIANNQVVVVSGETGSGKTTQLPKICLELGRGRGALIGHTQPRRIAARSVATRIASELREELGQTIGFQVRFTDVVSSKTMVKLMTDGILLAEIRTDPLLKRYDTIIVDEAHERSLNIDFILGYLARLLPRRPDLKVIITSATIDSQRFAEHFSRPGYPVPIIEVSGRTYPVEIRYRPLEGSDTQGEDEVGEEETPGQNRKNLFEQQKSGTARGEVKDQTEGICQAVDELFAGDPGDILVFLPGERDIRDTEAALAAHLGSRYVRAGERINTPGAVEILPLFARLSPAEQQRIFAPHPYPRIVLATNVAETSLTVPGIKYVIDPGLARISRYSQRTKVQRLPIEEVSQASARQRAGRCGRISEGICIRLYSEENFLARPRFTEPEILRTSLASVILAMASLNLGKVADFPFIDAPDPRQVRDGEQLLYELGALSQRSENSEGYRLTKLGKRLAKLPIDPRLARMLLEADRRGCVSEALVIVSALSMQDVRLRPLEHQEAADQAHSRFLDSSSDFLTYLNLWRYLRTQSRDLSGSAFRKMCQREFLHYLRTREWQDLTHQLRQLLKELGINARPLAKPSRSSYRPDPESTELIAACQSLTSKHSDTDAIHRSLLVGMLSGIGNWDQRAKQYLAPRGARFTIWPGSGLSNRTFDWVMAAELVETSRLFARNVARVNPGWIIHAGKHLVKRSYGEPYWSSRKGTAMVPERITLYGLTIAADVPIPLSRLGNKAMPALSPVAANVNLPGEQSPQTAKQWARALFITNALVRGDASLNYPFLKRNEKLLQRALEVEQRTRQAGIVAGEDALAAFFAARLGKEVTNPGTFAAWFKRQDDPHILDYPEDVLLPSAAKTSAPRNYSSGEAADKSIGNQTNLAGKLTQLSTSGFPDRWIGAEFSLPLQYQFAPGKEEDGITCQVTLEQLPYLNPQEFQWTVPGLWPELFTALIRALPKAVRRQLVPAPQVGAEVSRWIERELANPTAATGAAESHEPTPVQIKQEEALQASLGRLAAWAGIDNGDKSTPPSDPNPKDTGNMGSEDKGSSATPDPNARHEKNSHSSKDHNPAAANAASTGENHSHRDQGEAASNNNHTAPSRPLASLFIAALDQLRAVEVTEQEFSQAVASLPAHLRIRFALRVGKEQIYSRDLEKLQKRYGKKGRAARKQVIREALSQVSKAESRQKNPVPSQTRRSNQEATKASKQRFPETDFSSAWPQIRNQHAVLPAEITISAGEMSGRSFPGLLPQRLPRPFGLSLLTGSQKNRYENPSSARSSGDNNSRQDPASPIFPVRVARFDSLQQAQRAQHFGVTCLLCSQLYLPPSRIFTRWPARLALNLAALPYEKVALLSDLQLVATWRCLKKAQADTWTVRDSSTLRQFAADFRDRFEDEVYVLARELGEVGASYREVSAALSSHFPLAALGEVTQVRSQLSQLIYPGFLWDLCEGAEDLGRYLQAIATRLQKASQGRSKGSQQEEQALAIWEGASGKLENQENLAADPTAVAALIHGRWLIEELRVSLFAQPLGTRERVSLPRLSKLLKEAQD
ncbi:MAG: ATP-dependent RNA helicase HrpA [Varibaculum cambriense]|uniref:ATP-dependent RNA helicase HrpA n=1 Tax=Varibaculum cambriense TaxID=184870 RepID=UPI00241D3D3C|nr:ATP-dependent RNA helicase HrpA [Varibaculum cambriense]MBS6753710.1 ATP-dependent RNA helicase HrpA [Varibaculum cambriense]